MTETESDRDRQTERHIETETEARERERGTTPFTICQSRRPNLSIRQRDILRQRQRQERERERGAPLRSRSVNHDGPTCR